MERLSWQGFQNRPAFDALLGVIRTYQASSLWWQCTSWSHIPLADTTSVSAELVQEFVLDRDWPEERMLDVEEFLKQDWGSEICGLERVHKVAKDDSKIYEHILYDSSRDFVVILLYYIDVTSIVA